MYGKPDNDITAHLMLHEDDIPFTDEEKRRLWSVAARYTDGLPALSASIFQLNDLLSHGVPDLAAIVRVLCIDPSMAAQVMRLAASACGGDEEVPCRLDECAVLVGSSRLRSLVLTTPLAPTDYAAVTAFQTFCHHGHLTSRLCERIAHTCGHPEPHKARVAGLLHDIGELPLYLEHRRRGGDCGGDTLEHCRVGGWLARFWKLPDFLIDVIEHHHEPEKASRDPFLTLLTAAADEVSRVYGVGRQIQPAAHFTSDCTAVLDRRFPSLSYQTRHELARTLQHEFLDWVKAPVDIEWSKGPLEGKCEQWQSAL